MPPKNKTPPAASKSNDASAQAAAPAAASSAAASSSSSSSSSNNGATNKRRKTAAGTLNEDALSGEDAASKDALEQMELRAAYAPFSAALLYAWEIDHEDSDLSKDPAHVNNMSHEEMLNLLVLKKRTPPGPDDDLKGQLLNMQQIWARWFEMEDMEEEDVPGLLNEEESNTDKSKKTRIEEDEKKDSQAGAVAMDLEENNDMEEIPATQVAPAGSAPVVAAAPARIQAAPAAAAAGVAPPARSASSFPRVSSSPAPRPAPLPVPRRLVKCKVCAYVASSELDTSGEWKCPSCELRGDLSPNHPTNEMLVRMQVRAGGASAQPIDLLQVIKALKEKPTGQNQADTSSGGGAATQNMSRLDKHLTQERERWTRKMPLFESPDAGYSSMSSADAFDINDLCVFTAGLQPPSEPLLKLIRSGKLTQMGFAIPRLIGEQTKDERDAEGNMFYDRDGNIRVKTANMAPPLRGLPDFCRALFHTITLGHVGLDHVGLSWITLAATAVEIQLKHGWPVAAKYIDQLLLERVRKGEGFAKTSDNCYQLARMDAQPSYAVPSSSFAPRQGESPAAVSSPAPLHCIDYNKGNCVRIQCRFAHVCGKCGSRGHIGTDCGRFGQGVRVMGSSSISLPPPGRGSPAASSSSSAAPRQAAASARQGSRN